MSPPKSWVGGVLAAAYLVLAVFVAQDEVRNSHGGWINLRGFGTVLVTAPSQIVVGSILKIVGVSDVNYTNLGFADYAQISLHILVTAIVVYFVGAGLHFLGRKITRVVRHTRAD